MKTQIQLFRKDSILRVVPLVVMAIFFAIHFQACQKIDDGVNLQNSSQLKSATVSDNSSEIFYGHETFTRIAGKPVVLKKRIGNENLVNYESVFVVHIMNGGGKKTLVSDATIKIDGNIIFDTSDFSLKPTSLIKEITGLTENSELEVEIRSAPGSYIDFWISGTLKGVTDADGSFYKIVTIGTQTWMAENLKTTKYNDGTPIPLVTDNTAWLAQAAPAYCWYDNDEPTNKNIYGALYNWFTVNTGKLCPVGWHVPTDAEWTTLTTFLGGVNLAGGKLKETGMTHWISPNMGATNESGFTGLPGGYRHPDGTFYEVGIFGYWWSSTSYDYMFSWMRALSYDSSSMIQTRWNKPAGYSVRCIKD